MSTAKTILGIVPGLQATSILAINIPKKDMFKQKKPIKNIVKRGVGTMIGISLLKPTASMINALD